MRRKLVKQGQNALTVTLPAKWTKMHNLGPGDEVDIDLEQKGNLIIAGKPGVTVVQKSCEIDVEGMNRFQINRLVRVLYRSKIDEIVLKYKTRMIKELKKRKTVDILDICEGMTKNLIGLEITHNGKDKIIFQCFISKETEESIMVVERRIFLMLKEFMNDIMDNIGSFKKLHKESYQIHDKISKFCEYYMRAIVYSSMSASQKAANYAFMGSLDKLVDRLRYLCDEIAREGKVSGHVKSYLKGVFELFDMYYRYFYSIGGVTSNDVTETRYDLLHRVQSERFTLGEYRIIAETFYILHLINDFHEVKRLREAD
jgi:phosphate uptake regulator